MLASKSNVEFRSYKFHFIKDRFWIWALVLPFGLICWASPLVIWYGLKHAESSPSWYPLFGSFFLGIPCYLVGWIFVYSVMEWIYTRMVFTDMQISLRLPWVIFPLIPVIKKLDLYKIHRVNAFARYGTRTAVLLYYDDDNGVERQVYIPKFQHNPEYLQEIQILKERHSRLSYSSDDDR